MASSTVPGVKAALLELLGSLPAMAGVQLTYGTPGPSPEREYVWLGDVSGEQSAAAIGARRREERMSLTVRVSVLRQGTSPDLQRVCTERAYGLVAVLEDALRVNAAFCLLYRGPGQVVLVEVRGQHDLEERADDRQREAEVTVRVYWTARI